MSRPFFHPASRITRLAPHARSFFDPNARKMHLAPDASPYTRSHEHSHFVQQQEQTWAWRAHRRCMHVPFLCAWTRVWLEWQAARMAIRGLERLGQCDERARREARAETAWYFAALFCSADTATKVRAWVNRA